MMVCFLIGDAGVTVLGVNVPIDRDIGFWLTFVGAIAFLGGALMRTRETT
jgi:hypothetical protein